MHIAAFSINPLFAGTVMGGAPKHLQNIAIHLGTLGHRVTVICTRPPDSTGEPFQWHENVTVLPTLPFRQPFPAPYAVSGHELAAAGLAELVDLVPQTQALPKPEESGKRKRK